MRSLVVYESKEQAERWGAGLGTKVPSSQEH